MPGTERDAACIFCRNERPGPPPPHLDAFLQSCQHFEMTDDPLRWILHLDMDAFFASVEQLDDPFLRGRPVIVGGGLRGVVSTASYEARVFGVRSAMPMAEARRRCPQAVILRGNRARYVEKSREVMDALRSFSPLVEPAGIDEAYVDLTGLEHIFGPTPDLARQIRDEVARRTLLPCSVGLAPVKFLAKIASDLQKPAGVSILRHEDVPAFLQTLPVGKIPGVGKKTLLVLADLGMRTAGDVQRLPLEFWQRKLGRGGESLFARAHGRDSRPVEPWSEPKSDSAETTFDHDTLDRDFLSAKLFAQAERVGASLRKQGLAGRTVTLKIKFADFTQATRSRTLKEPTNSTRTIYETALALLEEQPPRRPLRLIGVGVSQFGTGDGRLPLLPDADEERKKRQTALDAAMDDVRGRFGNKAVQWGKIFNPEKK